LGVLGVYVARGLYADGAYFLFSILSSHGFVDDDKPRLFALLITQVPLVMAMKIGINDLNLLIRLHSFGLIIFPLVFWLAALKIQMKTELFWIFVAEFSVSYLCSGFFAIGEYNLCYSMAAFSAAIILKKI
jgi:hypothetical protein